MIGCNMRECISLSSLSEHWDLAFAMLPNNAISAYHWTNRHVKNLFSLKWKILQKKSLELKNKMNKIKSDRILESYFKYLSQ